MMPAIPPPRSPPRWVFPHDTAVCTGLGSPGELVDQVVRAGLSAAFINPHTAAR
jgi:hypothetical protein